MPLSRRFSELMMKAEIALLDLQIGALQAQVAVRDAELALSH